MLSLPYPLESVSFVFALSAAFSPHDLGSKEFSNTL